MLFSQRLCFICKHSKLLGRPSLIHRTFTTGNRNHQQTENFIVRYLRSLKWVPIPVGVGFAYIGYQQYGHVVEREKDKMRNVTDPAQFAAKNWQVQLYTALPLRFVSRLWGTINNLELPVWLRAPILKLYILAFDVNLDEAAVRDLEFYRNLGEFFKRRLTYGVRPIDRRHCVACPSDGKVLHYGRVRGGQVEQVKGLNYPLQQFLGPPPDGTGRPLTAIEYENSTLHRGGELYHCVIYLAPGDYHGFHSPTDWHVQHRRHFPGELLSVNPGIARWVPRLFVLNERAVYTGTWRHGFFSMTAVGATNVGSMRIYSDKQLRTNEHGADTTKHMDEDFSHGGGMPFKKGESFGEFNLGSTIVLLFEAPVNFEFKIEAGQKVKYGQPLGHVKADRAG